ncbi:DUF4445 domain-containing protein [Verrucomicrobiaceae bacterium N1E253]|uniref:DUF4445 domain-containing protein n=1 Tax=Oceaniferula marina TaxID=2748318 RepID=A0A851GA79_9BACT|nr:ASKHA domain-containing protein [Oceaniferula marina]NWK54119.1 DUF4445 domain-containing protein [Oceaniferula marina]
MRQLVINLDDGHDHRIDSCDPSSEQTLADHLEAHGFPLNTRCGKRGLCNGCEVRLSDGSTVKSCQIKAGKLDQIQLPERSRMEHRAQVSDSFRIDIPYAHQPIFPMPSLDFDKCNHGKDIGFAIDLGTTTVAVLIIDLSTGDILSRASGFNAQIQWGDNVLTRIQASGDPDTLRALQQALTETTFPELIHSACERAGKSTAQLAGGVIAGNTTMLHLLTGENPSSLGVYPFTPRFIEGKLMRNGQIGINNLPADTPLQLLPGIATFIGADIVAGIYATGMLYDSAPSLLVDIGTNGEIVLHHQGQLIACATAAGPAFEGGGLSCGTRARHGAISDLAYSLPASRLEAKVIGNVPLARASGICGSAYIDFLADGRRSGLISPSGRILPSAWESLPEPYRSVHEDGRALCLADTKGRGSMIISEVDIAVILQAKAAIGAGIETLLEVSGLTADEIGKVYLAGGFGMHLNVANAIDMGLLPGFSPKQIEVVGNTSLAGAMLTLIDKSSLDEMEAIREKTTTIELNQQANFEDCYINHLMLP